MATLKDTSALEALNEKDYINKLYDSTGDTQKQMLQDHYAQNTGVLDTEKQNVQQQTDSNLQRTYVEAAKNAGIYNGGAGQRVSAGASAQAALSQGNQQQKNVTELQDRQNQADAEIERRRDLLGQQYAAAIKQAQADGDMQRAQALYDAAKKEEAQMLAYKQQAAALMASRGDNSIYEELLGAGTEQGAGTQAAGETTAAVTPASGTEPAAGESVTPSWAEVLKNEESINEIYDAQRESQEQQLLMDYQKSASELEAQRIAQQRQTDKQLTEAYVKALQGGKNYAEVQTAYGQGSGTAAQAQLARDRDMQQTLTDLRGLQTGKDAEMGMQGADLGATYREALAKNNADVAVRRLAALIQAAEEEEDTLAKNQELVGQEYAKNGDYSILGKLYGLTEEQMRKLMPVSSGGTYYRKKKDDTFTDGAKYIQAVKDAYEAIERPSINAEAFNATVKTKYGTK